MGGFLRLLPLTVAVVAVGCSAPGDNAAVPSPPDTASNAASSPPAAKPPAAKPPAANPATRAAYTEAECRTAVLNDLAAPATAEWGASEFREMQGSFVLRGTATAQNVRGVPITHRFVCVLVPDAGRIKVYFRSTDRMYDEIVRLAGF